MSTPAKHRRQKSTPRSLILTLLLAVAMAVTGALIASAPTAGASNAPGDNGTVKTHNQGTSTSDVRDEPKVCVFYLDAFFFDGQQSVTWWIVNGTHGSTVLNGSITLDAKGHGFTSDYTLPNGMYKLYWTFAGEHGSAKHKVFKVDCGTSESSSPTPTPTKSHTPTPTPTKSHSPSPSGSHTPTPTKSHTPKPTHSVPTNSPSTPGPTTSVVTTPAPNFPVPTVVEAGMHTTSGGNSDAAVYALIALLMLILGSAFGFYYWRNHGRRA
jgi:hypothetical protein